MRFTVNVTWVSGGTESTCGQCGAISGARFGRPAPSFTVDARDRESAISQVISILNFPLNAEIDVEPGE